MLKTGRVEGGTASLVEDAAGTTHFDFSDAMLLGFSTAVNAWASSCNEAKKTVPRAARASVSSLGRAKKHLPDVLPLACMRITGGLGLKMDGNAPGHAPLVDDKADSLVSS